MQEELNRIRNKDYSQIDEKLYGNMGMATELDTTLAQLAELQKYLKSQIDSIEDEKQKEAAMKASQVVMRMNIQQSSRVFEKCQCKFIFNSILGKVKKISKSFKTIKQGIEREIKSCIFDITEMVNDTFGFLSTSSNRKHNDNSKLKAQVYAYQEQIHQLKKKNEQMQRKLDDWEKAQQRIKVKLSQDKKKAQNQDHFSSTKSREVISTLEEEGSMITDREFPKKMSDHNLTSMYKTSIEQTLTENDTPRLPMPLRRQTSLYKYERSENSVDKFMSYQHSRKQLQDNDVSAKLQTIKNSPSGKIQSQTQSPTKKLRDKENEILKLKGTEIANNRKSTKKLKLFSLI